MRRAIAMSAALAMLVPVLTVVGAVAPSAEALSPGTSGTAGSYSELVSKAASNTCLDGTSSATNGTKVQQGACEDVLQQQWKLVPSPMVSGAYEIQSASSPYLCLDGFPSPTSTAVQQWTCSGVAQQLWVPIGNLLINYNAAKNNVPSARCLEVEGAYAGGIVGMGPCTTAPLQQWNQVLDGEVNVPGCHPQGAPNFNTGIGVVSVVRINSWDLDNNLACAKAAQALGIKIYLQLHYPFATPSPSWTGTLAQDQQTIYNQLLPFLQAGITPWAVSIANEPDIAQFQGVSETPAHFAQVWQAVEPVIALLVPNAIRVGGEISGVDLGWLVQAVNDGLPGVQALSYHPYPGSRTGTSRTQFEDQAAFVAAYIHAIGKLAFMSEGLGGPNQWAPGGGWTFSEVQAIGVDLALESILPTG